MRVAGVSVNVPATSLNTGDVGIDRSAANTYEVTNGSSGSGTVIPKTDGGGGLGTASKRWGHVYMVDFTSGAMLEDERFPEELMPLERMVASLARDLATDGVALGNEFREGVRHLSRICMVAARAVVAAHGEIKRLNERVEALEKSL